MVCIACIACIVCMVCMVCIVWIACIVFRVRVACVALVSFFHLGRRTSRSIFARVGVSLLRCEIGLSIETFGWAFGIGFDEGGLVLSCGCSFVREVP